MEIRPYSTSNVAQALKPSTRAESAARRRNSFPRTEQEIDAASFSTVLACGYCNDLQGERYGLPKRPARRFLIDMRRSTCPYCRVVYAAIEALEPSWLRECKTSRDLDELQMGLSVSSEGQVAIHVDKNSRGAAELQFQIFRTDDMIGGLPLLPKAREIAAEAGDASTWTFIRSCLNQCRAAHDMCRVPRYPGFYPDRLLRIVKPDTGSGDGAIELQLIECTKDFMNRPYIAFSHCWGKGDPLRTLTTNIDRFRTSIPFVDLPVLYQDCLQVADDLEFEYIWIDSLCIIQDDKSDWARNSQVMNKIYGNANLTIAAVGCADSKARFLGPSTKGSRQQSQHINIGAYEFVRNRYQAKARRYWAVATGDRDENHLFKRAWAFQERAFSNTYLAFLPNNIEWTCRTCFMAESGSDKSWYRNYLREKADDLTECHPQLWYELLQDYSQLSLTYERDRLPALSGLASAYHSATRPQYLAGIWADDFPYCLAWHRQQHDSPSALTTLYEEHASPCPSWSWTSVWARLSWPLLKPYDSFSFDEYHDQIRSPFGTVAKLASVDCEPVTANIFGEVETGSSITVKAPTLWATMECDMHGGAMVRCDGHKAQFVTIDCLLTTRQRFGHSRTLNRAQRSDPSLHTEGQRISGQVLCLLLFTARMRPGHKDVACVLILAPHPKVRGAFQRLGIGQGDLGLGSPLYSGRQDWRDYERWKGLEEWEKWDEIFSGTKQKMVRIA